MVPSLPSADSQAEMNFLQCRFLLATLNNTEFGPIVLDLVVAGARNPVTGSLTSVGSLDYRLISLNSGLGSL